MTSASWPSCLHDLLGRAALMLCQVRKGSKGPEIVWNSCQFDGTTSADFLFIGQTSTRACVLAARWCTRPSLGR